MDGNGSSGYEDSMLCSCTSGHNLYLMMTMHGFSLRENVLEGSFALIYLFTPCSNGVIVKRLTIQSACLSTYLKVPTLHGSRHIAAPL